MNAVQKWLSERPHVKRLLSLNRILESAHWHAAMAGIFSMRPDARAARIALHRAEIDRFNARKPWYLRRRKYSL